MLKNYLKIAFRNLWKHKYYSLINILGLAIGLACTLLIFSYITNEFIYDKFHQKADRIYRVNLDYNWNGEEGQGAATPPPVAERLVTDFPEVKATTRVYVEDNTPVRYKDRHFNEAGILAVDSNFLQVFDFPLIEGNAFKALQAPNSVLITPEVAARYFNEDESPVGKTLIIWEEKVPFKITGIITPPPTNSHIQFDMLTTTVSHPVIDRFSWSWIWCRMVTYALLRKDTNIPALEDKMPGMVKTYGAEVLEYFIGSSMDEFINNGGRWFFKFQPITEIRLHSQDIGNPLGSLGDIKYLYIFMAVAVFVLLIACINFINLTTARSAHRAKEVGIRKTLGSQKGQLRWQFLMESLIYCVFALMLGLALSELLHLFLQQVLHLSVPPITTQIYAFALVLTFIIGILSGSYPAFYLTAFKPVEVLKGKVSKGVKSSKLRNLLVVSQFTISIGLIICTLLVYRQLEYVQQVNLGFDKENILVVPYAERLGNSLETFQQSLESHAEIVNVSHASSLPGRSAFGDFYAIEGKNSDNFPLAAIQADDDFLVTMGMEMAYGRYFSQEYPSDANAVVLNETAVRQFQLEDPIGKQIRYPGACGDCHQEYEIIGVVKDFNMSSLHHPLEPFAIFKEHGNIARNGGHCIAIRIAPGKAKEAVALVEKAWKTQNPGDPLEYSFLDRDYNALFQSEQQLGQLFGIFTFLTIFIACLGLLGLATYTAEQRTKEIGIRKVMGASVGSIVTLLSKDFTRLVLIAFLIAVPLAYVAMNKWLENFAYRTEIGIWTFVIAGVAALCIAWLTVSYQSIKAALMNPVKSLRDE